MGDKRRLIDEFKSEVMSRFIELCRGNDFNKLSLLRIGETINRIYEKYNALPTVDAVEVVRCPQCIYHFCPIGRNPSCGLHGHLQMEITEQSFCSAGMTEAQWLALNGDELEDGDPLKPK